MYLGFGTTQNHAAPSNTPEACSCSFWISSSLQEVQTATGKLQDCKCCSRALIFSCHSICYSVKMVVLWAAISFKMKVKNRIYLTQWIVRILIYDISSAHVMAVCINVDIHHSLLIIIHINAGLWQKTPARVGAPKGTPGVPSKLTSDSSPELLGSSCPCCPWEASAMPIILDLFALDPPCACLLFCFSLAAFFSLLVQPFMHQNVLFQPSTLHHFNIKFTCSLTSTLK